MTQYPTDEMIEAVARALHKARRERAMVALGHSGLSPSGDDGWKRYVADARAAIEAMRAKEQSHSPTGDDVERVKQTIGDVCLFETSSWPLRDVISVAELDEVARAAIAILSPNEESFPNDATKRMAKIMGCDFVRKDKWQPSGSPNGVTGDDERTKVAAYLRRQGQQGNRQQPIVPVAASELLKAADLLDPNGGQA